MDFCGKTGAFPAVAPVEGGYKDRYGSDDVMKEVLLYRQTQLPLIMIQITSHSG